ncbi:MAG TPA: hypothetical protein VFH16_08800 [Rubrobacter sp.]|jgi:hypothetical protein|nr:hypothetical protein [Rubrobacter sp.]
MSARATSWLAWCLWLLCVSLISFALLFSFLASPTPATDTPPAITAFLSALSLAFPTVGALVASRRPENPIGWIFCGTGLLYGVQAFASGYANYALLGHTGSLPGEELMAWLSGWIGVPILPLAGALLVLLFPNGKLLSRNWQPVVWMAVCGSAMLALGAALGPGSLSFQPTFDNPLGLGGAIGKLGPSGSSPLFDPPSLARSADTKINVGGVVEILVRVGFFIVLVSWLFSVAAMIMRMDQARGAERQQLKWFVYTVALLVVGFLAALLGFGQHSVAWNMGIAAFNFLPIAAGIAILRYRLYDIDVVINRTLVYGVLTAALALVYVGSIVLFQGLFRALTGETSQLAVVASTLAIAALFVPLRRRVQAFIDRRFYRRNYDVAKTLQAFNMRLRNDVDLDSVADDLVEVVKETMQPAHVSLWLRPPERKI